MDKDKLTVWTTEEVVDQVEYLDKGDQFYEKDEIDKSFDVIQAKVRKALECIKDIKGIDIVEECADHLNELENWLY